MSDLKVVFFGTPEFVSPVLEALKKNFQVVLVINSLEKFKNSLSELKNLQADLFVVAAFGKIIPQEVLDIPRMGVLNVHPSLLPKYRGPSPLQAAILNGDEISGVTIMQLDEKMDHGPILGSEEIELSERETFESLAKRSFQIGADLLVKLIPDYVSGKIDPKPQNDSQATYCKLIKKEAGYFEIENPPSPEVLDRMSRAYYPWPGVWTRWNGKIVKFLPVGLVQMEGKKATDLKSFLNGYPDFPIKEI